MAATLVEGFEHTPGHHCGSTALRDLLAFHGVKISEEMAFGLGAGASFYYFETGGSPSRFINHRTRALEADFIELTGLALTYDRFAGPADSWQAARRCIDSGKPAILLTDLYYLDHYGKSAHFPGHAITLAGYDDEFAYVGDTAFEGLVKTGLAGLEKARHVQHPYATLAGDLIHATGEGLGDPTAAVDAAIARAARRMIEPELGEYEGVPAMRRFASELAHWPEVAEDWQWCARFAYQVIERRGSGGGAFRAMYSRFLEEAGRHEAAEICADAADGWTELAGALYDLSETDAAEPPEWAAAGRIAGDLLAVEERLWSALS
jgi:hypothetical protein